MKKSVWLYVDLPVGGPTGAAYMAESWARELRELGWHARIYAPSTSLHEHGRTDDLVTYRTLKGIGFKDDHHPLVSIVREMWRARRRRDRPDAIMVTTPMRMGSLGLALATIYRVPLVIAVSTDTTAWALHHSAIRLIAVSWPKFALFGMLRPDLAVKLLGPRYLPWIRKYGSISAAIAAKYSWVFQDKAKELILLGERNVLDYDHQKKSQRVNVFPAGIDRLPEPSTEVPIPWREGALKVLFVGRLVKEKNIHLLLHATALARKQGLDMQLAVIGEGAQADTLPSLAGYLGIAENVIVGGPYPRKDLRDVYAGADVFAFASTFDTQGFVLNEAAHEGLPLLVADDINRVCVHEESALVVPQTPEAFAEGFMKLADPALRARLGAGARARAQLFTEAGQAREVNVILHRAIGQPLPETIDLTAQPQPQTQPQTDDPVPPRERADQSA